MKILCNKRRLLYTSLIITIIIVYTYVILGNMLFIDNTSKFKNNSLSTLKSTDPGNPIYLSNNTHYYSNYDIEFQNYYFKTYNMSAFDDSQDFQTPMFHLICLYTKNATSDFDLYLYNDSLYSNLVGNSTSGGLDWLVYCSLTTGPIYPVVHTKTGTGEAIIEAESSHRNYKVRQTWTVVNLRPLDLRLLEGGTDSRPCRI
ncbi:MAG: hypothetical protein ACFFD2_08475, partial [Promethearchaeota archaeon]